MDGGIAARCAGQVGAGQEIRAGHDPCGGDRPRRVGRIDDGHLAHDRDRSGSRLAANGFDRGLDRGPIGRRHLDVDARREQADPVVPETWFVNDTNPKNALATKIARTTPVTTVNEARGSSSR